MENNLKPIIRGFLNDTERGIKNGDPIDKAHFFMNLLKLKYTSLSQHVCDKIMELFLLELSREELIFSILRKLEKDKKKQEDKEKEKELDINDSYDECNECDTCDVSEENDSSIDFKMLLEFQKMIDEEDNSNFTKHDEPNIFNPIKSTKKNATVFHHIPRPNSTYVPPQRSRQRNPFTNNFFQGHSSNFQNNLFDPFNLPDFQDDSFMVPTFDNHQTINNKFNRNDYCSEDKISEIAARLVEEEEDKKLKDDKKKQMEKEKYISSKESLTEQEKEQDIAAQLGAITEYVTLYTKTKLCITCLEECSEFGITKCETEKDMCIDCWINHFLESKYKICPFCDKDLSKT